MKPGDTMEFDGLKLIAIHTSGSGNQCNGCFGDHDSRICGELPDCIDPRIHFRPIIDHEPTHARLAYLLLTNQLDWERTETNVAFEHPAAQSTDGTEPRNEDG